MAYLESAVVVYLREVYDIKILIKDIPKEPDELTLIELGREAATLVMLVFIGLIAGSEMKDKVAYFLISFGVWDIFYYFWLKIFINWPVSLTEWDLLFLIPLPWWGPVITPILISALMIFTGYLFLQKSKLNISRVNIPLLLLGILIILFSFMENGILLLSSGKMINEVPENFNWLLFLSGFCLMLYALVSMAVPVFGPGVDTDKKQK